MGPLRRLRRHLPTSGEDYLGPSGACGATSPQVGRTTWAPPAPAAPPPHKWGGLPGPLRRLRRHLPTSGEDYLGPSGACGATSPQVGRTTWAPPAPAAPPPHKWGGLPGPLRRLRRHLPTSGEDYLGPSGACGATSPQVGRTTWEPPHRCGGLNCSGDGSPSSVEGAALEMP